ncbi:hypothetical protein LXL04_035770 [Taraxacum kok-saghyz]
MAAPKKMTRSRWGRDCDRGCMEEGREGLLEFSIGGVDVLGGRRWWIDECSSEMEMEAATGNGRSNRQEEEGGDRCCWLPVAWMEKQGGKRSW